MDQVVARFREDAPVSGGMPGWFIMPVAVFHLLMLGTPDMVEIVVWAKMRLQQKWQDRQPKSQRYSEGILRFLLATEHRLEISGICQKLSMSKWQNWQQNAYFGQKI